MWDYNEIIDVIKKSKRRNRANTTDISPNKRKITANHSEKKESNKEKKDEPNDDAQRRSKVTPLLIVKTCDMTENNGKVVKKKVSIQEPNYRNSKSSTV